MKAGQSRTGFALFAVAFTALMFIVKPAAADQLFYFTFSGATVSGAGTLTASDNGDGSFTAISGTGTQTVNGDSNTLTLIANPDAPAVHTGDNFTYDNQLFPSNFPLISDAGLLFASSTGEVNLFSVVGDGYVFLNQNQFSESITFTLSDTPPVQGVPEPASLILVGIGLSVLAARRRRLL